MTPIYEVQTKHTKQVLMDFIRFNNSVKYPRTPVNLSVLAICFYIMAYISRETVGLYICIGLGTLLLVFLGTRKNIAFSKLSKADPNYQHQSGIHMVFGHSGFYVENEEESETLNYKYSEITNHYYDENYFYIQSNGEDLHMIPKADFTVGDSGTFKDFMEQKVKDYKMEKVNLTWKEKWEYNKKILKYGWANRGFTQFTKKNKKK